VKGEELRRPSIATITKVLAAAEMTYAELGALIDERVTE
jgi:hypothetical protein